ncbi:MAG: metal ABC transporter substrate-binding protein [Magnetococcales bacterium]|nr:metal ABC transporter substrate-binding protein [Magnetococcales bacterium]
MKRIIMMIVTGLLIGTIQNAQANTIKIVATHSILGDMAQQVGGDRVQVTTLVRVDRDPHTYEPTPADVRHLRDAKIVIMNGLGLEGWMDRLISSSGFQGKLVVASKGVTPRTMTEDDQTIPDPHAWNNAANGMIYVHNIIQALVETDPEQAQSYRSRGDRYLEELQQLDLWASRTMQAVPVQKRKVLISHDAFGYFGDAYGLTFLSPLGISTESEPSAGEIAQLIKQIRQEKIEVYFLESSNDPRIVQQLGKATGARAGGTLFVEALSGPSGPAPNYAQMFRHNVEQLKKVMLAP